MNNTKVQTQHLGLLGKSGFLAILLRFFTNEKFVTRSQLAVCLPLAQSHLTDNRETERVWYGGGTLPKNNQISCSAMEYLN